MTASPGRQRGMSMFGIFLILGVAIFIGMFAFKVGPAYMENLTVNAIAKDVADDAELMQSSRGRVYQALAQAYRMNNLWDLKPEETIVVAKDGKRGFVLTVRYEKRANLFGNIDVVTVFEKEAGRKGS